EMKNNDQGFTGVYLMFESGARGSKKQIRQLAAMRGLMSKPNGDIIESPIISNFREGLTVVEYFISSHGARKGLSDTALKTADAGYLTRRLVDVAQDVVIEEDDCGTLNGIWVEPLNVGQDTTVTLAERIVGRYPLSDIYISGEPKPVVREGEEIDEEKAKRIMDAGLPGVTIRSVLTCQSKKGVCAKCYGRNLATGHLVELGEAVGIIAAQSIGEPGTQLTMRTFHIGGTASRRVETGDVRAPESGTLRFLNIKTTPGKDGAEIVLNRGSEIILLNAEGKEIQRIPLGPGFQLLCQEGAKVRKGALLVRRDPYNDLVVAEADGVVSLEGMEKGVTIRMEINKETGLEEVVVTEHR
ncbi:MAG TPA: DNA-directed RNA polymerase subunit beta', partial [Candidatus Hydrogenedentes bacterium]|nr:DNA-directed RNA polymerase subunit beta' [Candidatus Hydrogenedentota bacterium]